MGGRASDWGGGIPPCPPLDAATGNRPYKYRARRILGLHSNPGSIQILVGYTDVQPEVLTTLVNQRRRKLASHV